MSKFDTLYEDLIDDHNTLINESILDNIKSLFKKKTNVSLNHSTPEFQKIPANAPKVSDEKFNLYGVNSKFFKDQISYILSITKKYDEYVNEIKSFKIGTLKNGCTLQELPNDNLIWYNKSKKKYMSPPNIPTLITKSGILVFCINSIPYMVMNKNIIILIDKMSITYDILNNTLEYSQNKIELLDKLQNINANSKIEDIINFIPGLDETISNNPSYISGDMIIYKNEKSEKHSTKHPAVFLTKKHPEYYLNDIKYKNAHEWLVELESRKP